MSGSRTRVIFGSLLSVLSFAACDGGTTPADASDVTDAATDMGTDIATDTPTPQDAPDVIDVVTADITTDTTPPDDVVDSSTGDATDSGPSCPSTPIPYATYSVISPFGNRVNIQSGDATIVGGPQYVTGRAEFFDALDTPTTTMGDCAQYDGHNPARASASLDYGTLMLTQGSSSATFNYDTSMGAYAGTGLSTFTLMGGMDVTFAFPATDAGVAQMVTVLAPPIPAVGTSPFSAGFTDPAGTMEISRTADTDVTWTPSSDTNMMAAAIIVDTAAVVSHAIVCGVHACTGHMTIPGSMVNQFSTGAVLQVQLGMWNVSPLPPAGRTPPINVAVGSSTAWVAIAN